MSQERQLKRGEGNDLPFCNFFLFCDTGVSLRKAKLLINMIWACRYVFVTMICQVTTAETPFKARRYCLYPRCTGNVGIGLVLARVGTYNDLPREQQHNLPLQI